MRAPDAMHGTIKHGTIHPPCNAGQRRLSPALQPCCRANGLPCFVQKSRKNRKPIRMVGSPQPQEVCGVGFPRLGRTELQNRGVVGIRAWGSWVLQRIRPQARMKRVLSATIGRLGGRSPPCLLLPHPPPSPSLSHADVEQRGRRGRGGGAGWRGQAARAHALLPEASGSLMRVGRAWTTTARTRTTAPAGTVVGWRKPDADGVGGGDGGGVCGGEGWESTRSSSKKKEVRGSTTGGCADGALEVWRRTGMQSVRLCGGGGRLVNGGREREGGVRRSFATGRDRGHGWGSEPRVVGGGGVRYGGGSRGLGHDDSVWGDEYGDEYAVGDGGGDGGQWSASGGRGGGGGGSYNNNQQQQQQQPDMMIDWRWRARLVGHRGQRVKRLMERTGGRVMTPSTPQLKDP